MAERAAYSRVYWSIIDDPKFESIYDSNDHLATWLRLLLIADQAWPAPAHLPRRASSASISALVKAGLLDIVGGGERYKVHGLEAERQRRRSDAERIRTRSARDAERDTQEPHALRGAHVRAVDETRVDEGRRDETKKDEGSRGDTAQSAKKMERVGNYLDRVSR